jgi:uncharacterized protein (DUF2267 family)
VVATDYDGFIQMVADAAHIGRDDAVRATSATLKTLGERIVRGEADDLAAQLPPEIAPFLEKTEAAAEGFDFDEFVRRVSEREGVDLETAERHARAVFAALGRALTDEELEDLAAELPEDIRLRLLPKGTQRVEVMPFSAFVDRVAGRAGLDHDLARRATDAVLETLAERIAGGEVDDLIEDLPVELHPPLKRGKTASGGQATRMSLDEFVRRVAQREGVAFEQALEHSRAVLATLREAIPDSEFYDVAVHLPDEYDVVLARR